MDVRLWQGDVVETEMFTISNPVEWSLLCSEQKRELRTTKKLMSRPFPAPRIVMGNCGDSFVPFVFLGMDHQMLGDMTDEDARAEGMSDLEAFKDHWMRTLGHAYFPVHERVRCYRLMRFHGRARTAEDIEAMERIVSRLYPTDLA